MSSSSSSSSSSSPVSNDCTVLFNQMKENNAFLYIVYMVDTATNSIVVERTSPILTFPNPLSSTLSSHPWSIFQRDAIYLPSHALAEIFSLLSAQDLLSVVTVCSYWKDVLAQHSLSIWQSVAFRDYCTSPSPPFSLELTKHNNWRDFVLQRHLEKARPTEVWKEFVETLPNDQCRYIAYCMRRGEKREPYYVFIFWALLFVFFPNGFYTLPFSILKSVIHDSDRKVNCFAVESLHNIEKELSLK